MASFTAKCQIPLNENSEHLSLAMSTNGVHFMDTAIIFRYTEHAHIIYLEPPFVEITHANVNILVNGAGFDCLPNDLTCNAGNTTTAK